MLRSLMASKRVWVPFVAAALVLFVASARSPLVMFVLTLVAIGLLFDGATLLWSRGSNLTGHRQ